MDEIKFLKGVWLKSDGMSGRLVVNIKRAETMFAVTDVKRVCARKVTWGKEKKAGLVVTCKGRLNWGDENDFYFVTDTVDYVAKALNRPEEELSALILQKELEEDK